MANIYCEILKLFHDTRHVLIKIRKFIVWLSHGLPGSGVFRGRLFQLQVCSEVVSLALDFFYKTGHLPIPKFELAEAFMMGGHG